MPTIESLLGIPELSRLCRLDEAVVRKLVESARTPAPFTLSNVLRFRASEIDRWLKLGCPDRETFERQVAEGDTK